MPPEKCIRRGSVELLRLSVDLQWVMCRVLSLIRHSAHATAATGARPSPTAPPLDLLGWVPHFLLTGFSHPPFLLKNKTAPRRRRSKSGRLRERESLSRAQARRGGRRVAFASCRRRSRCARGIITRPRRELPVPKSRAQARAVQPLFRHRSRGAEEPQAWQDHHGART